MAETILTREKAEKRGFKIDDTVYPWLAYKGPRFRPEESARCLTDREAALALALRGLLDVINEQPYGTRWPGQPHAEADKAERALKDTWQLER